MKDTTNSSTRRALLRAGGSALAATSITSTAGCFGTLPPLGGRVDFGRVDAPDAAEPTYRELIPAPSEFAGVTDDDFELTPSVVRPQAFHDDVTGPTVHAHAGGQDRSEIDYFGIGWRHFHEVIDYFGHVPDPTYLVRAPFDTDNVVQTLLETGYERSDPIRGATALERPDLRRVVGLDGSSLVWATGERARDHVGAVLDAKRGDVDRFHETNEGFDVLATTAGANPATRFSQPTFSRGGDLGATQQAESVRVETDAIYHLTHLRFERGETPTLDELKRTYRYHADHRTAVTVDVAVDDRIATVETRQARRHYLGDNDPADDRPMRWPQVTWGVDHDPTEGTVRVTHDGGEPVPASRLQLEIPDKPGFDGRDTQFADVTDTVTAGDTVTVDVSDAEPDQTLLLGYWIPKLEGATMFNYHLGGTD